MNRREDDDSDDTNRWLVSYADFITLLFALFVVLYAYSQANEAKHQALSEAIGEAFGRSGSGLLPATGKIVGNEPRPTALDPQAASRIELRRRTMDTVRGALRDLIDQGSVTVTETPNGLVIDFNASALFETGIAEPSPAARESLTAVGRLLAGTDYVVNIEGHTDDTPINTRTFASNWELSAARAAGVAKLFEQAGVAGTRLVAMGFGEHRPVAENASPEGKARNRRIVAILKDPCDAPAGCAH